MAASVGYYHFLSGCMDAPNLIPYCYASNTETPAPFPFNNSVNMEPVRDNWYQSGRSVACDSYFHTSAPHLYLAQPPPSSKPPPQAPTMVDPNHHQPPGPICFSDQFQYHGHSPLPPPPNHNQQQAFLGDFRPWEREYGPSMVISTSYSSTQHTHIQNASSMITYLPPTFASMATSSIPISNYTGPAHTHFISPANQPNMQLSSVTSHFITPTPQQLTNPNFSYKLPNLNNEHEVFDERSEGSTTQKVLITGYSKDNDCMYSENSIPRPELFNHAFTNSRFQIQNHHFHLSSSPSHFPNSFANQFPQLPEIKGSSLVYVDGPPLGDKEVGESEVWESKVDEIIVGGSDEWQDSEWDKDFKEATDAENLWVDSEDAVKNSHSEDSLELTGNLNAGHKTEKLEEGGTASMVAQAVVAVPEWKSSSDTRKSAISFLESVKDWDHLVWLQSDELNPTERRDFTNAAVDLTSKFANLSEEWALKSQTAALIAEIFRREGLSMWQEFFPSLISLSNSGPTQAELVCMILRWLPEDVAVHKEDMEGDWCRLLLRGLTESLPEILPLLYNLLKRHFGATFSEAGKQQLDITKQHATTVTATLNAVNAYIKWAPTPDLLKYGIIHGCSILLSSPDFRLHACEFFKLVSSRKRPIDAASEVDSAMSNIFQVMVNVSSDFLYRSGSSAGVISKIDLEFVEYICENMMSLGSLNLQCISGDSSRLSFYLQQILGYFQHFKLALHYQSLLFWLALLRDLLSKPKTIAHAAGDSSVSNLNSASEQDDDGKRMILTFLNDEIGSAMLEISFQRSLKKEKIHPGTTHSFGVKELWSDDFESKGDFSQYRSRLLELIRLFAFSKPILAATKVSERIIMIIKSLLIAPTPTQNLAVLESMQLALENVVTAVCEGSKEYEGSDSEIQLSLGRTFEGILQQLLSLKWTEPALVELLGRYLDTLGPILKYHSNALGSVINKLFELLISLPSVVKDPLTSSARHARLQIYTSFIWLAKAAGKSLLPHMKGIADTMSCLQKEGGLLRGEHNHLGEAFIIMASTAGVQQHQEALAWLLEPLRKQWIQIEWQNAYWSNPAGLIRLCSETQFMWLLFHTVMFFEKALKRSGGRKGNLSLQNNPMESSTPYHPLVPNLLWMLPPLLKLLRAIHSLWSPPVTLTLYGEIKAIMVMSNVERTSLLGEGKPELPKGGLTLTDGSLFDMNKEGVHAIISDVEVYRTIVLSKLLKHGELNRGYGATPLVFDPGGFWKLLKLSAWMELKEQILRTRFLLRNGECNNPKTQTFKYFALLSFICHVSKY